jgi:beta-ureidopropionase / N-carbamoyl-L-amino-acid hydrolase
MQLDSNMKIDGDRLWASLMEMAKIGATPKGGVNRLTLTDLDRESRELFKSWCEAAGCTMRVDKMGTMFMRREGADASLPPVMVGSHLDTQPTGGKFDGALGVLSALELVRTLNDLGIKTKHPIEVVNFTNEEGSRFAPAMLASGVMAGAFDLDYAYARRDVEGKMFGDELQRIGYAGPDEVGGRPVHAFFEVHIEQGPILEESGTDIGVVTHANGQFWYEITFEGVESHAGPTPMSRRKDALVGAAAVIQRVNEIGHEFDPAACATCGFIESYPNSRNVIPGRVFLTVDFRHPDQSKLDAMDAALKVSVEEICGAKGLTYKLERIFEYPVTAFDETCVSAVRNAADKLGFSHRDITSGAGHDAVYMARIAPAAMVFTPCIDGISHNEAENMTKEWAAAGGSVLLHAVLDRAGIVD